MGINTHSVETSNEEVGVEGKAILNTLSLYNAKAHAIDKTEWMFSVLVKKLKDLPFYLISGESITLAGKFSWGRANLTNRND